jgi:hypothetical protein
VIALFFPQVCSAQASLSEARAAAQQAVAERQVVLEEAQAQRQAAAPSSSTPFKGTAAAARRSGSGGSRTPVWKQYAKKKALGKQAEATLEMIFSRTQVRCAAAALDSFALLAMLRASLLQCFRCAALPQHEAPFGNQSFAAAGTAWFAICSPLYMFNIQLSRRWPCPCLTLCAVAQR